MQIIWMIFFLFALNNARKWLFSEFLGGAHKKACFTSLKANKLDISLDLILLGLIHEVRNLSQYLIRFTMLSMFWFCIRNITCKDVMLWNYSSAQTKLKKVKFGLHRVHYIRFLQNKQSNNSKSQTVNTCWITWVGIPYWEWGPLFRCGMKRGLVSRL